MQIVVVVMHALISIHALLAESDGSLFFIGRRKSISIHALLAESDKRMPLIRFSPGSFLSTLSLRRATSIINIINNVIDHFYPRSPCGERPAKKKINPASQTFLSTLSLRRATISARREASASIDFYPRSPCGERPLPPPCRRSDIRISIHALLAESDRKSQSSRAGIAISIHALLAESDKA